MADFFYIFILLNIIVNLPKRLEWEPFIIYISFFFLTHILMLFSPKLLLKDVYKPKSPSQQSPFACFGWAAFLK